MNSNFNSDLEMATNASFSSILNEIQLSNLNFTIEMTPFAAFITLKKTVLKDKNSRYPFNSNSFSPQQEIFSLRQENANLKADVDNSTKAIDEVGNKLENAHEDLYKSLIKNNEIFTEAEKLKSKLHTIRN